MIKEIQIIPPVATYQQTATLNDLRCINYIFGANGTGKTTISRVIAGKHENRRLEWQGGNELECMVYNRDFVDSNFKQGGPLQGVFTLGENQVEAENKINKLKLQIDKVNEEILSLNIQLDGEDGEPGKRKERLNIESVLSDKCWRQKKLHDDYFQTAFSGVRNSAENFKEKVLAEQESNASKLLSLGAVDVLA